MPKPKALELQLPDEAATCALGRQIARALQPPPPEPLVIHLTGELGSGKTCLVRGLLRELGVADTIRSPTFTLLEIYEAGGLTLAHLDLYRLDAAAELEQLGLRELLAPRHVLLIEWPERGGRAVPKSNLEIELAFQGKGRKARLTPVGATGDRLFGQLK